MPRVDEIAGRKASEAQWWADLDALLKQLMHHHRSQAKPHATLCRPVYHRKLAGCCERLLKGPDAACRDREDARQSTEEAALYDDVMFGEF